MKFDSLAPIFFKIGGDSFKIIEGINWKTNITLVTSIRITWKLTIFIYGRFMTKNFVSWADFRDYISKNDGFQAQLIKTNITEDGARDVDRKQWPGTRPNAHCRWESNERLIIRIGSKQQIKTRNLWRKSLRRYSPFTIFIYRLYVDTERNLLIQRN